MRLEQGTAYWSLSPDGARIALVETATNRLEAIDLKTGKVEEIHPQPPQEELSDPAWSAEGDRLFVSAFTNTGKGRLLEIDLTGRTWLLHENPFGGLHDPWPSPDGRRIAYDASTVQSNVTLLEHF